MRIVVENRWGKFYGEHQPYNEENYNELCCGLLGISNRDSFSMQTEKGRLFIPRQMIQNCIFSVEK